MFLEQNNSWRITEDLVWNSKWYTTWREMSLVYRALVNNSLITPNKQRLSSYPYKPVLFVFLLLPYWPCSDSYNPLWHVLHAVQVLLQFRSLQNDPNRKLVLVGDWADDLFKQRDSIKAWETGASLGTFWFLATVSQNKICQKKCKSSPITAICHWNIHSTAWEHRRDICTHTRPY